MAGGRIQDWLNPAGDRAFHVSGFWLVMTYLLTSIHQARSLGLLHQGY